MQENTVNLTDWNAVVTHFQRLFEGLGEVIEHKDALTFNSVPPDVATSLTVRRDGRLAASMPLHAIEVAFSEMSWNETDTEVVLSGEGNRYVYRIPEEILRHKQR